MPHNVPTRVYKYNPYGFLVIGIYIICLGIFIFHLLLMSMSTLQIGIFGAMTLAVPLYVRYGNNPKWRMMVWDEQRLVFSSTAIDFGDDHYPVNEMETAAVYLESFDGFKYRAIGMPRNKFGLGVMVEKKTDGDNNKISFRHGGETEDFTFYLANYAEYAELRKVIYDWSAAGVNVVVRQIFDDEFIKGEREYFNQQV
jgi:hypothetical protein